MCSAFCPSGSTNASCSTFAQKLIDPTGGACAKDPDCIDVHQDLFKNIRHGLIDPETPDSVKSRKSYYSGKKQVLVVWTFFLSGSNPADSNRSFRMNSTPTVEPFTKRTTHSSKQSTCGTE